MYIYPQLEHSIIARANALSGKAIPFNLDSFDGESIDTVIKEGVQSLSCSWYCITAGTANVQSWAEHIGQVNLLLNEFR